VIYGTEIIYIDRIDKASNILKTNLRVGVRRPIFVNSIGKVIRAYLPEAEQARILDRPDLEYSILMETGRIISRAMGYIGANKSTKRRRKEKIYD